jgi:ketopantoate reductase
MREAWIIGMGEVGRRVRGALEGTGWTVHPVTRDRGWKHATDAARPGPRIVAVREEDLDAVLERLAGLEAHLVLVQNGFLEALHGDLRATTRGLVYFTSKADFFRVLCASPFRGPHAQTMADALRAAGIAAEVENDETAFVRAMIVKGIWNAVVGLPLAVHETDLAGYLVDRREELEQLVAESADAAGAEYGTEVDAAQALRKLLETTGDLGWVRGGTKALAWRNGALAWFGRRHGRPTPVNDRLLRAVGYDPGSAPSSS